MNKNCFSIGYKFKFNCLRRFELFQNSNRFYTGNHSNDSSFHPFVTGVKFF